MANILVITTDLPFFPGKNGNDFFNLRYLSQRHSVGLSARNTITIRPPAWPIWKRSCAVPTSGPGPCNP